MWIIVVIVVGFITVGLLYGLVEKGMASRTLRPYLALLLIAALIAVLGVVTGFLFDSLHGFFFTIAKIVAVLTCTALCLHLIAIIGKRWL